MISAEQAKEYEPHVAAVSAVRVESTGIVDFGGVCNVFRDHVEQAGGEVRLDQRIVGIVSHSDAVTVTTKTEEFRADQFVNCAGLHSDRLARLAGLSPDVRIIPFRGEYYELTREASYLVKGLIYPVPDPAFPFLGVHLTRTIDGSIHAGPNAIFALAREGYTKLKINPRDVLDSLRWPGLWRSGQAVLAYRTRGGGSIAVKEAIPGEPARTRPRASRQVPGADGCWCACPGATPRRKTCR